MKLYKYEHWLNGKMVDVVTIWAKNQTDAVSQLSKQYKGVFRCLIKEN